MDNQYKQKRILYITADYPPRLGGQSQLSQYVIGLLRESFEVIVYLQQDLIVNEPGVFTLNEENKCTLLGKVAKCSRIGLLVSRAFSIAQRAGTDFDLVIAAESERSSIVAGYFSRFFNIKKVVNFAHGRDFSWRTYGGFRGRLHRWFLVNADLTIANSEKTKQRLLECRLAKNVEVIYPPVSLKKFFPSVASSKQTFKRRVILTVARLTFRKGVETVLEALAGIEEDFLYLVIGNGPLRGKYERLAAELGLGKRVVFLGNVNDEELRHYLQACDFFVLTPYEIYKGELLDYEGFGMVYLEANACGKPVIGTRTGGVAESILEGVSGFIVDPKDILQTRLAIHRLLTDIDLRKKLSLGALEWAKKFDILAVGDKYKRVLEKVLDEEQT